MPKPGRRYADVFLSHHCSSMNKYAVQLDEKLRALGINTFICTSMKPGDDFRQQIIVNAVKTKIFVAFCNEPWAKSEECISEFNCALRGFNVSGSPSIMPIIIGGFGWIDVEDYPDVFNITSNTNCAVVNGDDWDPVFDALIDSIKDKLGITDEAVEPAEPEQEQETEEEEESGPLEVLPLDAAEDVKECALAASWYTANTRFGGDTAAHKEKFNDSAASFAEKLDGRVSAETCDTIKWMFWSAAWHTANERKGYTGDSAKDKVSWENNYQSIVDSGELSVTLVDSIRWMDWNAAWFAANTGKGYTGDAAKNEAAIETWFACIHDGGKTEDDDC